MHLGTQRRSGPAMTENSKLIADLLARRRQQISRLAEHQGVIETIRADIAAIEATIQICAPDLGERLRKQQTPSHHIEFNKGEALQLSFIALKKSDGLPRSMKSQTSSRRSRMPMPRRFPQSSRAVNSLPISTPFRVRFRPLLNE